MMDASLLQDFITESTEHLEEMENYLLQLESGPDRQEVLHDIFRCVHTIKGASEFVGLEKIATFSHRLENLLDRLRQGAKRPDDDVIDLLMAARDCLVQLVGQAEGNCDAAIGVDALMQKIDFWTSATADDPGPVKIEPSAFDGSEEPNTAILGEDDPPPDLSAEHCCEAPAVGESTPEAPAGKPAVAAAAFAPPDPGLLGAEIIENEENDRELFAIFVEQLNEKIDRLTACARTLDTGDDWLKACDACIQDLSSLKSSANYMGYKGLKRFLEAWIAWVGGASEQGLRISTDEMMDCVEAMAACFPDTRFYQTAPNSESKGAVDEPFQSDAPAAVAAEAPIEKADDHPADDRPLEDRLRDAFDLFDVFDGTPKAQADAGPVLGNEEVQDEPAGLEVEAPEDADLAAHLPEGCDRPADAEPLVETATDAPSPSLPVEAPPPDSETDAAAIPPEFPENPAGVSALAGRKNMRVDAEKIDSLMNQVGELVVNRSYFSQLVHEMRELQQQFKETGTLESREMKHIKGLAMKMSEATSALGRVVNDLQDGVMKIRMLPIAQLFNRYPRLVRDLVHNTGKKVRLEIKGESTELDKMIIEQMSDPLIHIIRNAVDHGIETVEQRLQLGKPAEGLLQLIAYHESNHVVIEIVDDGRGIDPEKIYAAALERGFLSKDELDRMTPKELAGLILRPGFSTATEITHTSGRGVGMDVVKKNIEKLNGAIEIDSRAGVEMRLRIKIPLTLAIISALLVRVGHKPFAIPLTAVEETLRIGLDQIGTVEGFEVIELRQRTLPLLRLSDMFAIASSAADKNRGYVVIVSTGMHRIGLLVDTLIGQEEVVIKPLAEYIQEDSAFSGATILGDGNVSLILDGEGLVNLAIRKHVMKRSGPLSQPVAASAVRPDPGIVPEVAEPAPAAP
ncbi:MAG TPA: chemotaxis protein CheW [Desulfobacterales bacterium]